MCFSGVILVRSKMAEQPFTKISKKRDKQIRISELKIFLKTVCIRN